MGFTAAWELFIQAFNELFQNNYYFQLRFALWIIGMLILYFVLKLTNRD